LLRANQVLTDVGVDMEYIKTIKASYSGASGSSVDIELVRPGLLDSIKPLIKALNRVYREEKTKKVYFDARKSRQELRPSRLVHRAWDYVMDVEMTKEGEKATIAKELRGKFLTRNGVRIGASIGRQWRWLQTAWDKKNGYTEQQLHLGLDWINVE
jgi:hypothetical protein